MFVFVCIYWVAGRGLIFDQRYVEKPGQLLSPHKLSFGTNIVVKLLLQALLQCWSFSLLAMLLPHFLVNSNCMENRLVSMLNGSGIAWRIKGHKVMAAVTAQAGLWDDELRKTE